MTGWQDPLSSGSKVLRSDDFDSDEDKNDLICSFQYMGTWYYSYATEKIVLMLKIKNLYQNNDSDLLKQ